MDARIDERVFEFYWRGEKEGHKQKQTGIVRNVFKVVGRVVEILKREEALGLFG